MVNWANFVSQVFNGLALGALLALICSGLTIIYGTLGVLNLAHGAMFMLGGYAGYVAYHLYGSFVVAVIAGSLFVAIVGILMERVIIRHFYNRPHEDRFWSRSARHRFRRAHSLLLRQPVVYRAAAAVVFRHHVARLHVLPTYRLAVVGIIAVALTALFVVLYRTRIGMIVRAGIEDSAVDALGINVYRVFMIVFGIGAMAAGFAGIVNAPVVSLTPGIGDDILVQTFVVVVIGGVGSFPGAILGGLIAGEIISITSCSTPATPTSCCSQRWLLSWSCGPTACWAPGAANEGGR